MFRPGQSQASLFGDRWLVVFVCVPDLPDGVFTELMRYSEPSFVFDLRLAPRFDLGSLNRERAFELFDRVHATYVDATVPLMAGGDRERAIEMLIRRFPTAGADSRRPIMFLLGRADSSLASPAEILSLLNEADRDLEVVSLPASE
jgi:hypothetical protein